MAYDLEDQVDTRRLKPVPVPFNPTPYATAGSDSLAQLTPRYSSLNMQRIITPFNPVVPPAPDAMTQRLGGYQESTLRFLPSGNQRLSSPDMPLRPLSIPPTSGNVGDPSGSLHRLQSDGANYDRLLTDGSGVDQIMHPLDGHKPGFLRRLGGVAARIGDVALSAVAPGVSALTPGTSLHHQVLLGQASNRLNQDIERTGQYLNQAKSLEDLQEGPQTAQDRHDLAQAQIGNYNAEAYSREHPTESWTVHDTENGPVRINQRTGEAQAVTLNGHPIGPKVTLTQSQPIIGPDGKPHTYMLDAHGNKVTDLGEHYERPNNTTINQGTWSVVEDAHGNPVLFNSKTGATQTAPPGIQKPGTYAKQQAALKPASDALDYADEYLKNGAFTGSGDEALLEKFFELAKPSSGFRMSQPQIDLLKNAQSWKDSGAALLRHAAKGTWFSDQQRREIVGTMQQLATAKLGKGSSASQAPEISSSDQIPASAAAQLREGVKHTFGNGQVWTKRNGQPVRVQ